MEVDEVVGGAVDEEMDEEVCREHRDINIKVAPAQRGAASLGSSSSRSTS